MIPDMNCKTCSHYNAGTNTCDKYPQASTMFGCSMWFPDEKTLDWLSEDLKFEVYVAVRSVLEQEHEDQEESVRRFVEEVSRILSRHLVYMVAASFALGHKGVRVRLSSEPSPEDA